MLVVLLGTHRHTHASERERAIEREREREREREGERDMHVFMTFNVCRFMVLIGQTEAAVEIENWSKTDRVCQ